MSPQSAPPRDNPLPRWRGFNLLGMFSRRRRAGYDERDFDLIAEWGFDFVRLPLCYRLWLNSDDPLDVNEEPLKELDRAVELGRARGLHVCINLHHAPGYCINKRVGEPGNLWKEPDALEAFCFHWELLARRYRGHDPRGVSFNLVNEPPEPDDPRMSRDDHERVMRTAIDRIRRIDPDRLILLDGLAAGRLTCPELADTGASQSCRGYHPLGVSHYMARWVHGERWPEPTWPGAPGWYGRTWDRRALEEFYAPWRRLVEAGVGVHCGEGGCYNRTPHDVFLRWFRDVLEILTAAGIGWALWNLRGPFGVLESGRRDVHYEPFRGHQLDRKLLDLLREF